MLLLLVNFVLSQGRIIVPSGLEHETFRDLVSTSWNEDLVAAPLAKVMQKIHRLKLALKHWNVHVFADINTQMKEAQNQLAAAQMESDSCIDSDDLVDDATLKLNPVEKLMESMALFMSKIFKGKWEVSGERSTKM